MSSDLPSGFSGRTLTTLRLAAKMGTSYVKRTVRGGPAEDGEESHDAEGSQELVNQLGKMKGLMMKFGQMASYLPGSAGAKAQGVLSQLQASSPPLPFETIAQVITAEFGKPLNQLFDSFEQAPLAAASIGQVHRAVLGGKQVVVKVQYPGIVEALKHDLKNVGMLARLGTLGTATDGAEMAAELRERILEECDYRLEARNQHAFAQLLAKLPNSHVPAVYEERTATRVITTEFVQKMNFSDFLKTGDQRAIDTAGITIFRGCFHNLFQHAIFNGDPHPGNYLFDRDGNVTFLDYGSVRTFESQMIDNWKHFAKCVTNNDRANFPEALVNLGFAKNPKKVDWDFQWEATRHLYTPFLHKEFTVTPEFVTKTYDYLLFKTPNKFSLTLPREWLLLNRLQWGLYAVLAQMRAKAKYQDVWQEAIHTPTTPIVLDRASL